MYLKLFVFLLIKPNILKAFLIKVLMCMEKSNYMKDYLDL